MCVCVEGGGGDMMMKSVSYTPVMLGLCPLLCMTHGFSAEFAERGEQGDDSEGDATDQGGNEDLEGYDDVRLLQPFAQIQEVDEDFEREIAVLTMQNPSSAVPATSRLSSEVIQAISHPSHFDFHFLNHLYWGQW
jgi:hypothetical protein